jgi:cellulose synthase/poly-beta-1,6-N-acetylglucosamine synthase-like glycosyltransferase
MLSIIIAAHNEEKSIRQKLENVLSLDYPKDRMEIIVASDGSTDLTNKIVKEYEKDGVSLIYNSEKRGKSSIQNDAVKISRGEIIVFSDTPAVFNKKALRKIVQNFNDPEVGCVTARTRAINIKESAVVANNEIYWLYEEYIQMKESEIGILSMSSGWLFAVRKELFIPLNYNVGDDFVVPLDVVSKGCRVVFEKEAIAYDRADAKPRYRFNSRVRVTTKDARGLFVKKELLNILKFPLISLSLISHKLLRWLVPYFLAFLFIVNIFLLASSFYLIMFILQIVFYMLAFTGFTIRNNKNKNMLFSIPFYYCLVNYAAMLGMMNFILGKRTGSWRPVREGYEV